MIHTIKIQAFHYIKLFEPGIGAEIVSISPFYKHNHSTII
jgi:hypothetical protein